MVGSFLFALGSFPPYSQLIDGRAVGITFVIGSLFFTAGGYSAFLQVFNDGRPTGERLTLWAWSPRTKLRWAAFVQLIGTLLFLGAICFLVGSYLGFPPARGRAVATSA